MATNNSAWLATANKLQAAAQQAFTAMRLSHKQGYNEAARAAFASASAAYLAHLQTKPSEAICNT